MLAGILASLCCRIEHLAGGWKQLLALPVRRTAVYFTKFFYVLLFLALVQGLVLLGVLVDGLVFLHIQAPIPRAMLNKGFIGGWIATLPLATLQLWVSNSSIYAPMYPWAQPMLAMLPGHQGTLNITTETAMTITIAGIVFIIGGWLHFTRRDIRA
ncbi:ABC transporter permease [Alicyclobacillus kakegawensis]|uniref:ABC transporter permease n=1 Tax=Alicyclobacillus kakegawensis TaxID=392012 RepID=UPI0009F898B2